MEHLQQMAMICNKHCWQTRRPKSFLWVPKSHMSGEVVVEVLLVVLRAHLVDLPDRQNLTVRLFVKRWVKETTWYVSQTLKTQYVLVPYWSGGCWRHVETLYENFRNFINYVFHTRSKYGWQNRVSRAEVKKSLFNIPDIINVINSDEAVPEKFLGSNGHQQKLLIRWQPILKDPIMSENKRHDISNIFKDSWYSTTLCCFKPFPDWSEFNKQKTLCLIKTDKVKIRPFRHWNQKYKLFKWIISI